MPVVRIVQNPRLYTVWCLIVIVALATTYFGNPHVFAFTTLGLMWLSIAVTTIGFAVVFFAQSPSRRARVEIIAASLGSLVAVVIAMAVLRTFNWA